VFTNAPDADAALAPFALRDECDDDRRNERRERDDKGRVGDA
jgi:hypothetical protein